MLGISILTISVCGSFELLRLSDLQARHASIDARAAEILREYNDYLLYIAYDRLPNDGQEIGQGYLYQLCDASSNQTKSFYKYTVVANVQTFYVGTAEEQKEISISMICDSDAQAFSDRLVRQTISGNAVSRSKI